MCKPTLIVITGTGEQTLTEGVVVEVGLSLGAERHNVDSEAVVPVFTIVIDTVVGFIIAWVLVYRMYIVEGLWYMYSITTRTQCLI